MPVAAARIGAPVLEKSAAEQVVTGPVLVPGRPDRERHQYTAENIREIATSFLPRGEVDVMHAGGAVGHPTENFVTRERREFEVGGEGRTIPTGSWMLSAKVTDKQVWRGVERGKLTGFSVFGPVRSIFDGEGEEIDIDEVAVPIDESGRSEAAVAANSFSSGYARQIPPAPVGETWTIEFERATHVSLIDDPAVWDARFIVAKSAGSSASRGGREGANGGTQEIIMNDELEERLTAIQKEASASAEAAQDAADSAEAAQQAAESAGGDSDDDGGGDGEIGALREELGALSEQVSDLLDGDDEGVETSADDDDDTLDPETVQRLVDEGVLSEEELSDLDVEVSGVSVEKRLAALEKAYQQGGRRGRASALDGYGAGNDDGESGSSGSISKALAGGEGGDGQ